MMVKEKLETKTKLVNKAKELFAQHGFKGTSVRLIADSAGVNIASVNYHFGSKESLYWSVIDETFNQMDEGIKQACEASKSIEEMAENIFVYFRQSATDMLTSMKVFLSDAVPPPDKDHAFQAKKDKEYPEPPGAEHIKSFLQKSYPDEYSEEARRWFVTCFFSCIYHVGTMCSSPQFEDFKKDKYTDEDFIADHKHLALAMLSYMKQNKNWKFS